MYYLHREDREMQRANSRDDDDQITSSVHLRISRRADKISRVPEYNTLAGIAIGVI